MRNITAKQNKTFIDKLCKALKKIGAVEIEDKITSFVTFEIQTIVGKLTIIIDTENISCYTMYSRFEDVEKAKLKFNCNPFSGKYNTHIGKSQEFTPEIAVDICVNAIERTLQK